MKKIETKTRWDTFCVTILPALLKMWSKDTPFRKGHIVTQEDIPLLLSLGKTHLYVWENDATKYHENEAAEILCSVCINDHMERTQVREGKIELIAAATVFLL